MKNLISNISLDNKFFSDSPKNLIVCNDDNKIELSKIKLITNSDFRLIRCYNNLSDYKYKINTESDCFIDKPFIINFIYGFNWIFGYL